MPDFDVQPDNSEKGTEFKDRMEICAKLAGNATSLAEKAGISRRAIGNYLSGDSDPTRERLIAIAKAARVDIAWLVTGVKSAAPVAAHSDTVEIKVSDTEISAGHGSQSGDEATSGTMSFRRDYLIRRGLQADKLRIVFAKGDSMEPEIQDGAATLVNTADTRLDEGCIYVIRLNDHLFAKRVHRNYDGSVSFISGNTLYPPMTVPKEGLEDVHVVGRVVWSGREH